MIVVRVELWSARTGAKTEIARMHICNVSGVGRLRDYAVSIFRGRSKTALDRMQITRRGNVRGHPSDAVHVWHLIFAALKAVGYTNVSVVTIEKTQPPDTVV